MFFRPSRSLAIYDEAARYDREHPAKCVNQLIWALTYLQLHLEVSAKAN